MPVTKCVVDNCESSDKNNVLFCIPRAHDLRAVWLQLLVPHSSQLRGKAPSDVLSHKVCVSHFEAQYLRFGGRRPTKIHRAFPTLFTSDEVLSGRPNIAVTLNDTTICHEHNYSSTALTGSLGAPSTSDTGTNTCSVLNSDYALLHSHSHEEPREKGSSSTNCSNMESTTGPIINNDSALVHTHLEKDKDPTVSLLLKRKASGTTGFNLQKVEQPPPQKRIRLANCVQAMTPNCRKMYKKCKDILKCKRRLKVSYEERLQRAHRLNEDTSFRSMLDEMTPEAKTFLNMQISQHNRHVKRRRFNTDEKLLALALSRQSPKAYKLLRKMFILPSRRTLNKFIQEIDIKAGINKKIFLLLKESVSHWDEKKKFCSIVYDEMSISSYLKFVESDDSIQGFVDFGSGAENKIADHVLVFMVRGICNSWRQTVAYYFCEGTTPYATMKNLIRDMVTAVGETGLIPKALVCDQGSTFQRAVKSFQSDTKREQILQNEILDGRLNIGGYKLNIIYDPPHLIKGIRNNFLTKDLLFKGKCAKWSDIMNVYESDKNLGGVRALPKLTDEHVHPDKISACNPVTLSTRSDEAICP